MTDEPMKMSKKVFHNAREIVKIELFGTKRSKPMVVPKITKLEKYLGRAICKATGRTPMQLSHLKSDGRWLIALRVNRKTGMLLEGRDGERWWTITFSHGMSRKVRQGIVRNVMKKHERFRRLFYDGVIDRDIESVQRIGYLWREYCEKKEKGERFTTIVKEEMRKMKENRKSRKKKWVSNKRNPMKGVKRTKSDKFK